MSKLDSSEGKISSVQVITRAANILQTLKKYPTGLSLGQIAKELGLAKSTVQRIVNSLDEVGFVTSASPTGGYRLGPGLAILAASVQMDLKEDLHPYLEQLSKEIEETVDLAMLDHGKAICIDQITASHRLQAVSKIGASFPLHCTANGKALLAAMPTTEKALALLPDELISYTPNTIISKSELVKEIEIIRKEGIAYDREEFSLGICAVGSIIHDAVGNRAAITIPIPSTRFYGNEEKLVAKLLETCEKIKNR